MGSTRGKVECGQHRQDVAVVETSLACQYSDSVEMRGGSHEEEHRGTYKLKNAFPASGPLLRRFAVVFYHSYPITGAYAFPGPAR